MAYTLDIALALGTSKTGITDLRAQLVDTSGANVGSAVSTGFTEIGQGNYLWHYASFPDAHRGGVKFYSAAASSTILAFAALNPEEAERIDQAVSAAKTLTSAYDPAKTAASQSSVDAAAGNISSLLGKLTGITLLAKWLQALARKSTPDATALSEINSGGGTYDAATDSLEGSYDNASGATPATFWAYAGAGGRTLTQTTTQITNALTGGLLTIYTHSTFRATETGTGIADTSTVYWTVKRSKSDADSAALIQVKSGVGLTTLNGAAYGTPAHGSISVSGGTATYYLDEAAAARLAEGYGLHSELKEITAAGDALPRVMDTATIILVTTRAIT